MKQRFNLLTGKFDMVGSGGATSSLESEIFTPILGQTIFTSSAIPKGKVIFVINGVQINSSAILVNAKIITYDPLSNEGYIIQADDLIQINYLK
jgi:hypothetical protein